jgi:hypothetical protein
MDVVFTPGSRSPSTFPSGIKRCRLVVAERPATGRETGDEGGIGGARA